MISHRRLVGQLEPLGEDRADQITSLAAGIDETLRRDAVVSHLLGKQYFPAIAALYASALRLCNEAAADPLLPETNRQTALATRELMLQVVGLVDSPVQEDDEFRSILKDVLDAEVVDPVDSL